MRGDPTFETALFRISLGLLVAGVAALIAAVIVVIRAD